LGASRIIYCEAPAVWDALCDLARVLAAASGVSYVDFAHASGWSRPALCASLLRYYVRVLGTPIVA
jgi:hypothetical protein